MKRMPRETFEYILNSAAKKAPWSDHGDVHRKKSASDNWGIIAAKVAFFSVLAKRKYEFNN